MRTEESLNGGELALLRRAIEVARAARAAGNHPFGAILADSSGEILAEAENTVVTSGDCTGHAETNLTRVISRKFDRGRLRDCTLYSSAEPCAMCAGAIHWSGVGRLVYGCDADRLYAIIRAAGGNESGELRLPCREVLGRAEDPIPVLGPALEGEAVAVHEGFWESREG